MTRIIDFFGFDTTLDPQPNWADVLEKQRCAFVEKNRCYKVRKSQPEISIGTCTVEFGGSPVIICPLRFLQHRKIFTDCLHLLGDERGNEIHIASEVSIPGGSIDYILASVHQGKVRNFVGLELQALDTTGTVWPERQRFLAEKGVGSDLEAKLAGTNSYGMNWKMTAKTSLLQLHHKIQTFESVNRKLVLVVQDRLLDYMKEEFSFEHLKEADSSDPMHFHAYTLQKEKDRGYHLDLTRRLSTDTQGIATCLRLKGEARLELDVIHGIIERKLTNVTRLDFAKPLPAIDIMPEN